MNNFKLNIELVPKGAWNNNLRTTLSKDNWDKIREVCYKKANESCDICGYKTDKLEVHEVWEYDINKKSQTLVKVIALCKYCHGVKHFRNSERLGYGENAKKHFLKVNNCSEIEMAKHIFESQLLFEERNKVLRWKIKANLEKLGLKGIEIEQRNIPFIVNPYEEIEWELLSFQEKKALLKSCPPTPRPLWITPPKVISILVDNYQGIIEVVCNDTNKIEWFLDEVKIKTKYNVIGKFITKFKVENLMGKSLYFKLTGDGGETISKIFDIFHLEMI